MGFFRRDEPGVRAQAKLLGLGPTPSGARSGRRDVEYQLRLAVTMPDGGVVETDYVCRVPHEKILFDEMPKLEDRARASAGAAAALGFKLKE